MIAYSTTGDSMQDKAVASNKDSDQTWKTAA